MYFHLSVGMYPEKANLPISEESNLKGDPHPSSVVRMQALMEPPVKLIVINLILILLVCS